MKFLIIFLITILAITTNAAPLTESQYEFLFSRFIRQFDKNYENHIMIHRYNVFKENLSKIMTHNEGSHSYKLAVNQFGDYTQDEFKKKMTGFRFTRPFRYNENDLAFFNPNETHSNNTDSSSNLDWRVKNVVNPVKNQGQCGSCWAFSAINPVESRHAIKTGKLLDLSEQQLVDCASSAGNEGCNGGLMDAAYTYYAKSGGACLSKDYPYNGKDGICATKCKPVVSVTGYKWIPKNDENALKKAVDEGPVSIAIQASSMPFQFYAGGILDSPQCGQRLDHGVSIVGYGTENGKDYWIVRNSWGESWGENGYIRMARGKNMCGLASEPLFPVTN